MARFAQGHRAGDAGQHDRAVGGSDGPRALALAVAVQRGDDDGLAVGDRGCEVGRGPHERQPARDGRVVIGAHCAGFAHLLEQQSHVEEAAAGAAQRLRERRRCPAQLEHAAPDPGVEALLAAVDIAHPVQRVLAREEVAAGLPEQLLDFAELVIHRGPFEPAGRRPGLLRACARGLYQPAAAATMRSTEPSSRQTRTGAGPSTSGSVRATPGCIRPERAGSGSSG